MEKRENQKSCNHQYIVGYSFRMPQPFFRDVPCDNCGVKIKLSLMWRLIYGMIEIFGFVIVLLTADKIAELIDIKVLGNNFWIAIVVCIPLFWIMQIVGRQILSRGKWIKNV